MFAAAQKNPLFSTICSKIEYNITTGAIKPSIYGGRAPEEIVKI